MRLLMSEHGRCPQGTSTLAPAYAPIVQPNGTLVQMANGAVCMHLVQTSERDKAVLGCTWQSSMSGEGFLKTQTHEVLVMSVQRNAESEVQALVRRLAALDGREAAQTVAVCAQVLRNEVDLAQLEGHLLGEWRRQFIPPR